VLSLQQKKFMPVLTLATFNCENLFRRYKFDENLPKEEAADAVSNGLIKNAAVFTVAKEPDKVLRAKVIKDTKADIIALQEVENLDTLKNFCSEHNLSKTYPYKLLIDGNDPRLIDVAVLSKYPFESIVTHQYKKNLNKEFLFSRDCLELEFSIGGKPFHLYINHLKSMFDSTDSANGRAITAPKRIAQVDEIIRIVEKRFGEKIDNAAFAIVGDFNDYPSTDSSLIKLHNWSMVKNIVENMPIDEQWTHYWNNSKLAEKDRYKQLDYIWLSKSIYDKNKKVVPVINRKGLSKKLKNPLIGKRYAEIENLIEDLAASDHCSVTVTIDLGTE
jgi:endonuclease/exonuclease/phosphatase family metal-dependent hydrolase